VAAEHLDAKAQAIFEALAADVPVRAEDGGLPAPDAPAIRLLADALCRLDSIAEYLARRGWEDESGRPRPVLDYEARLRGHALDLMRELGMTPAARAKLGLDLARLASPAERLDAHLEGRYGP
jgi:phage terminase small subunit